MGDLDLANQAKLLRVLETGIIEPVGGESSRQVDVRVVAATNKDLESEVQAGKFRKDLYFRLNVFPIQIPPLRDRLDDLSELVDFLGTESRQRCGSPKVSFSQKALTRLEGHSWPGNVRELANLIERLTIVNAEREISESTIQRLLGTAGSISEDTHLSTSDKMALGLAGSLEAYERQLIEQALSNASGNVADAARRLQTDRANLYRRMKRLGLDPKDTSVSK